jgi:hypothetical protein
MELAGEPEDVEREIERYRTVARVLDCPLIAKLGVQDLHALIVARQVSSQSDWAERLRPRVPALA